jgi:hypothetical protein
LNVRVLDVDVYSVIGKDSHPIMGRKADRGMKVEMKSRKAIDVRRNRLNPKSVLVPMTTLLTSSDRVYDTSPAYQRDFVWSASMMQSLIDSIVSGRTIPPIHVSSKPFEPGWTEPCWWVVDGKQRIETIRRFVRGVMDPNAKGFLKKPFCVWLVLADGSVRRMTLLKSRRR